ncbi:alpha-like toxin CsEv5 [Centruroides sculpturatus]|uniref:alpha-like toxin CsEv5 n=1 Tax=Centruroides sculpturatus TaxID=218467 RepID=UPI000C6D8284|nr:alpha-like toxin CsEv5 [Centruroides sculpturatus]
MKSFILFISCLMVIDVFVESKDGFPLDSNGCKISCDNNDYCETLCKSKKANTGYCTSSVMKCYCEGLPSDVDASDDPTEDCN